MGIGTNEKQKVRVHKKQTKLHYLNYCNFQHLFLMIEMLLKYITMYLLDVGGVSSVSI